ncbi:MAG: hypothetical protein ACLP0J_10235 [Solirubrobacteraceae bacterium]
MSGRLLRHLMAGALTPVAVPSPTFEAVRDRWLAAQTFEHQNTELAFIDDLAACDGLATRREALDERLSWVALDPEVWPRIRRLRALSGIDTSRR